MKYPTQEHLTHVMLEDLGFERFGGDDTEWTDNNLRPFNLKIVDWGNGSWHFAIFNGCQGIGKMKCLDDLIIGYKFVTGLNVITKEGNP